VCTRYEVVFIRVFDIQFRRKKSCARYTKSCSVVCSINKVVLSRVHDIQSRVQSCAQDIKSHSVVCTIYEVVLSRVDDIQNRVQHFYNTKRTEVMNTTQL